MSLQLLQEELLVEFPRYRMLPKTGSLLMRSIDVVLRVITLWRMQGFMTDFITTVGYTVYVPSNWDFYPEYEQMVILRHERVHMRQRARYGSVLFSFLYLFFPLPCAFAYFRKKFEQEAYEESLRALVELHSAGRAIIRHPATRERHIKYFTGASYFWTWPWRPSLERWFDRAATLALK